jgi:uncharacterized protein (TIGR02246 family)
MRRMTTAVAVLALVAWSAVAQAQKADPDAQKLADDYQAAFNKGDVKAITGLYTADAIRLGPDGQLLKGHEAIEKGYTESFAGPLKGAKLTLQQGGTQVHSADVKVIEGRYSATGANTLTGRYVNTIVKKAGAWKLGTVVTIPDPPAAPKK